MFSCAETMHASDAAYTANNAFQLPILARKCTCEELPAVVVPLRLNTGLRALSALAVMPSRTPSSLSTRICFSSPCPCPIPNQQQTAMRQQSKQTGASMCLVHKQRAQLLACTIPVPALKSTGQVNPKT